MQRDQRFLAGAFLAGGFFAVDFFAVDFFAVDFFAVDFEAGAFLADDFFAGADVAAAVVAAAAFFVGAAFFEAACLAADFLAAARRAFRLALRVDDGENLIAVEAAIFTGSPVWGLRPVRAVRWEELNDPKPGQPTLSPLFADEVTIPKKASSTFSASALETAAASETFSSSSALVIVATATSWFAWRT
ncbi:hypothetical protein BH18ACT4_BH18ACT4_14840 [soil metagenome]